MATFASVSNSKLKAFEQTAASHSFAQPARCFCGHNYDRLQSEYLFLCCVIVVNDNAKKKLARCGK